MTDREKLVALLMEKGFGVEGANIASDHLIANGVTFATDKNDGGKWISTTDYLPHPNIPVAVVREDTSGKQYLSVEMFNTNDGKHWFWSKDDVSWRLIVTHWMPLPEPPKGET